MDHTQCLCNCHSSLVLGQSIQFMEYSLYLVVQLVPQQLLREFLCYKLGWEQCLCDSALTEPPLFDLFCRQGKNRE
jgi:hypothetical protein